MYLMQFIHIMQTIVRERQPLISVTPGLNLSYGEVYNLEKDSSVLLLLHTEYYLQLFFHIVCIVDC